MCPYPHLDTDAVANIKAAEMRQKDMHKEGERNTDRGRSPSRDKKCKKGRKRRLLLSSYPISLLKGPI